MSTLKSKSSTIDNEDQHLIDQIEALLPGSTDGKHASCLAINGVIKVTSATIEMMAGREVIRVECLYRQAYFGSRGITHGRAEPATFYMTPAGYVGVCEPCRWVLQKDGTWRGEQCGFNKMIEADRMKPRRGTPTQWLTLSKWQSRIKRHEHRIVHQIGRAHV